MGSGVLKTLLSDKVAKDQFLYVFSCRGHSSEPCVGLLLRCLRTSGDDFFIHHTSVIDDCLTRLTQARGPIRLRVSSNVPRMLGTVATQMSLFMAGVTLNFS